MTTMYDVVVGDISTFFGNFFLTDDDDVSVGVDISSDDNDV